MNFSSLSSSPYTHKRPMSKQQKSNCRKRMIMGQGQGQGQGQGPIQFLQRFKGLLNERHISRPEALKEAVKEHLDLDKAITSISTSNTSLDCLPKPYKTGVGHTQEYLQILVNVHTIHVGNAFSTELKAMARAAITKFMKTVNDRDPPHSLPDKEWTPPPNPKKFKISLKVGMCHLRRIWMNYTDWEEKRGNWKTIPEEITRTFHSDTNSVFQSKSLERSVHQCLWGRLSPYATYNPLKMKEDVQVGQMRCLREGIWLSDIVISAYCTVLSQNKDFPQNTVIANPPIMARCTSESEKPSKSDLRWAKKRKENATSQSGGAKRSNLTLIVPLNETDHWVVYVMYVGHIEDDCNKGEAIIFRRYCSLGYKRNNNFPPEKENMVQSFKCLWNEWYQGEEKLLPNELHHCVDDSLGAVQRNESDCGVFCCAVTTCLVNLLPNTTMRQISQKYISNNKFRSRICASIMKGKLVLE